MKQPEPSEWKERDSYRKQILATEEEIGFDGIPVSGASGKSPEERDERSESSEFGGNLLQVVEIPPGEHVEPHFHRETEEVFYIQQAGGTLVVDGTEVTPEEGEVIICEPGDVHEVINDADRVFRILVFKVNLTDDDTVWES
ncbi:cupin domain-containing protein [Halorientalis salina]|uniref:cupin domain-containing protein n=1 Tax=Halorientalis salina TaxID=2932266 RepID=UPI0010AC50E8|nr:cupin domain-containing protein [Halorientalis salina]